MKTPLGTEVDLGPGHIVLDGDPAPLRKVHSSAHLFGPCLLWPPSPMSAAAELLYKFTIIVAVIYGVSNFFTNVQNVLSIHVSCMCYSSCQKIYLPFISKL